MYHYVPTGWLSQMSKLPHTSLYITLDCVLKTAVQFPTSLQYMFNELRCYFDAEMNCVDWKWFSELFQTTKIIFSSKSRQFLRHCCQMVWRSQPVNVSQTGKLVPLQFRNTQPHWVVFFNAKHQLWSNFINCQILDWFVLHPLTFWPLPARELLSPSLSVPGFYTWLTQLSSIKITCGAA